MKLTQNSLLSAALGALFFSNFFLVDSAPVSAASIVRNGKMVRGRGLSGAGRGYQSNGTVKGGQNLKRKLAKDDKGDPNEDSLEVDSIVDNAIGTDDLGSEEEPSEGKTPKSAKAGPEGEESEEGGKTPKSAKAGPESEEGGKTPKSAKAGPESEEGGKTPKSIKTDKRTARMEEFFFHPRQRECTSDMDAKKGTLALECPAQDEFRYEDEIAFNLKAHKGDLLVNVMYTNEKNGTSNSSALEDGLWENLTSTMTTTTAEYTISFHGFVEYKPSGDESLGYNVEEDRVIQTLPFDKWNDFGPITQDADGVYTFSVTTDDDIATFYFHLSEEDLPERGLSANRIKVDVEINDFPFKRSNTLVALLTTIGARNKVNTHYTVTTAENGERGHLLDESLHTTDVTVNFGESNGTLPFGELTWVNTADLNNGTGISDVVATSPPEDYEVEQHKNGGWGQSLQMAPNPALSLAKESNGDVTYEYETQQEYEHVQLVAFSFLNSNKAEQIYWDPSVGLRYPDEVQALNGTNYTTDKDVGESGVPALTDGGLASSASTFLVSSITFTGMLLLGTIVWLM